MPTSFVVSDGHGVGVPPGVRIRAVQTDSDVVA